jgi:hypothetical protein
MVVSTSNFQSCKILLNFILHKCMSSKFVKLLQHIFVRLFYNFFKIKSSDTLKLICES